MKPKFFLLTLLCLAGALTAQSVEEIPDHTTSFIDALEFVTVSDVFNMPDNQGRGMVMTNYQIGKYEITAEQYCAFLNAVTSATDAHHLYKQEMSSDPNVACIVRREENGITTYIPISGREKFPITYVSLSDAERFCNWLEQGAPTDIAAEEVENITEQGSYVFTKEGENEIVTSNPQAHYRLPSENEWIKAAYYKRQKNKNFNADYWLYPSQSDTAPGNNHGDITNEANYKTSYTLWSASPKGPVLTPVDFFPQSKSAYGCYDMGGNVAEWAIPESNTLLALILGGSWQSEYSFYNNNDLMRTAAHKSYDPTNASNFIGFRIVFTNDVELKTALQPMLRATGTTEPIATPRKIDDSSTPSVVTVLAFIAAILVMIGALYLLTLAITAAGEWLISYFGAAFGVETINALTARMEGLTAKFTALNYQMEIPALSEEQAELALEVERDPSLLMPQETADDMRKIYSEIRNIEEQIPKIKDTIGWRHFFYNMITFLIPCDLPDFSGKSSS